MYVQQSVHKLHIWADSAISGEIAIITHFCWV